MSDFREIISNAIDKEIARCLTIKIYKGTGILTPKAQHMLREQKFNPTNNYNIGYRDALLELGFIRKHWLFFFTNEYVLNKNKIYKARPGEDNILADLNISLPYDSKDLI